MPPTIQTTTREAMMTTTIKRRYSRTTQEPLKTITLTPPPRTRFRKKTKLITPKDSY